VTHPLRTLSLALMLAAGLTACTVNPHGPATPAPTSPAGAVLPDLTIAFVEDLSRDGAEQRVAPAFQGARLAIDAASLDGALPASVHVVPMDTGGTPEGVASVARRIVDDPTVVAAIVAPQLTGQVALGDPLDAAGVPTISLSTLGPDLPERAWQHWRRAVPDVDREATAIAKAVVELDGRTHSCVLGDGTPASDALNHAVVHALPRRPAMRFALTDTDPDDPTVIAAIKAASCRSVVWSGTPAAGGLLRMALVTSGLRDVRLIGGESLKDASYITTAGPRGRGTVSVCPCVDVSTSTDLRDQRFIQDYQSAFGVPPGPFAAEAWDVARMILRALEAGDGTRAGVAAALGGVSAFDGLARSYAFASNGLLKDQADGVLLYRDEGVRWVPWLVGTPGRR
jgi:branched-chain amino acid transport system substrate-binding protein